MLAEQTFRVSHKHGNIILIANSDTDKVSQAWSHSPPLGSAQDAPNLTSLHVGAP